ncbi:MAG: FHA domain-containing protein [Acidimicrobiia bacterium]|jgi:pSer/pThr/pTyr-binding forkhead associated (FHA) protein|nr:FHA domain-containing protein [Acidimicrobiia bacterium]
MTEFILALLKLIFIALLFLFVWQIARAIGSHLGGFERRKRIKAGSEIVFVRSENQSGLDFTVEDVVVVGRSDQADVFLDDSYASEFHMRFSSIDGALVIQDLGSTNGTYVNGRRIATPVGLSKGDAVQVGKTVMEVR